MYRIACVLTCLTCAAVCWLAGTHLWFAMALGAAVCDGVEEL